MTKDDSKISIDHSTEQVLLALERTFLSWIRTGLTALALGIAISQFVIFKNIANDKIGHRVGHFLILWGAGLFIYALTSYQQSYKKIAPHKKLNFFFKGLTIITLILIVLSILLFWVVLD